MKRRASVSHEIGSHVGASTPPPRLLLLLWQLFRSVSVKVFFFFFFPLVFCVLSVGSVACAPQESNVQALDILFTYHGAALLQHRLAILHNFPETTSPHEYTILLPEAW